jgi:hypothetical protein
MDDEALVDVGHVDRSLHHRLDGKTMLVNWRYEERALYYN